MKQKIKNNKKEKTAMRNNPQDVDISVISQAEIERATAEDFRNALLVVSIFVNLIVLVFWIILQVTTQHDYEIASLIFNR